MNEEGVGEKGDGNGRERREGNGRREGGSRGLGRKDILGSVRGKHLQRQARQVMERGGEIGRQLERERGKEIKSEGWVGVKREGDGV